MNENEEKKKYGLNLIHINLIVKQITKIFENTDLSFFICKLLSNYYI